MWKSSENDWQSLFSSQHVNIQSILNNKYDITNRKMSYKTLHSHQQLNERSRTLLVLWRYFVVGFFSFFFEYKSASARRRRLDVRIAMRWRRFHLEIPSFFFQKYYNSAAIILMLMCIFVPLNCWLKMEEFIIIKCDDRRGECGYFSFSSK